MIASCYSMDLYCRHWENIKHPYNYFPHQFTGETLSECKKQAIKKGWIFHKDGEVTCPLCAKNHKKEKIGFKPKKIDNQTFGWTDVIKRN